MINLYIIFKETSFYKNRHITKGWIYIMRKDYCPGNNLNQVEYGQYGTHGSNGKNL